MIQDEVFLLIYIRHIKSLRLLVIETFSPQFDARDLFNQIFQELNVWHIIMKPCQGTIYLPHVQY